MREAKSSAGRAAWLRFSLRGLLLAALVTGPALGLGGPLLLQVMREWTPGKPPPLPAPRPVVDFDHGDELYESAETPLR